MSDRGYLFLVELIECLPHTHPRMEIGPISKMLFNSEYWPIEKFQKNWQLQIYYIMKMNTLPADKQAL
jgi:hypothetical protein